MMDEIGLLDLVFVLLVAFFTWRLFNAVHSPPNQPRGPLNSVTTGLFGGFPLPHQPPPLRSSLEETLAWIRRTGGYADDAAFLSEARRAYRRVVEAFAAGQLQAVNDLLSDAVRKDFEQFIAQRNQRGETETLLFVGVRGADIVDAGFDDDKCAWVEVRFASSMVLVTHDAQGWVVHGHPALLVDCAECWTFGRRLHHKSDPWLLWTTDSDE